MNGHWFLLSMLIVYLVIMIAHLIGIIKEERKDRWEEEEQNPNNVSYM